MNATTIASSGSVASSSAASPTSLTSSISAFLFTDKRTSVLWFILRVWLGFQWLDSGLHKMSDPAWMTTGAALKGFWGFAINAQANGRPLIGYDWYRAFLSFMLQSGYHTWFAKLVTVGEILVGVALIVGAFVGIAAFFGAFMNWNYIMAGSASTNGLMLIIAIALILAWKVAGWIGADRWILRALTSFKQDFAVGWLHLKPKLVSIMRK